MAAVSLGAILERRERLAIGCGAAAGGRSRPVRHVALYAGAAAGAPAPPRRGTLLIIPGEEVVRFFAGGSAAPLSRWRSALSCLVFADAAGLPGAYRRAVRQTEIPAFASAYPAELLQSRLVGILRELSAGIVMVHGVLVDLAGCGLLLVGESGVGKTSYGLEMARRGHCWVADDAVLLQRRGESLFGRSHPRTRGRIATRDRGIVPVHSLLGAGAMLAETKVAGVVRLERGAGAGESPAGVDGGPAFAVLGLSLPSLRVTASTDPVRRARLATELIRRWQRATR